jgi:chromosome segregation ATPase
LEALVDSLRDQLADTGEQRTSAAQRLSTLETALAEKEAQVALLQQRAQEFEGEPRLPQRLGFRLPRESIGLRETCQSLSDELEASRRTIAALDSQVQTMQGDRERQQIAQPEAFEVRAR